MAMKTMGCLVSEIQIYQKNKSFFGMPVWQSTTSCPLRKMSDLLTLNQAISEIDQQIEKLSTKQHNISAGFVDVLKQKIDLDSDSKEGSKEDEIINKLMDISTKEISKIESDIENEKNLLKERRSLLMTIMTTTTENQKMKQIKQIYANAYSNSEDKNFVTSIIILVGTASMLFLISSVLYWGTIRFFS